MILVADVFRLPIDFLSLPTGFRSLPIDFHAEVTLGPMGDPLVRYDFFFKPLPGFFVCVLETGFVVSAIFDGSLTGVDALGWYNLEIDLFFSGAGDCWALDGASIVLFIERGFDSLDCRF